MLFEAFKKNRENFPNAPAIMIAAGDRYLPITWRQFTDDINDISFIIRRYSPGSVIALLGENSYEWMVSHAAIIFSGAVALPIDVNLSAEAIVTRMTKVGAKVLVHSALYAEKAAKVQQLLRNALVVSFGSRKTTVFLESLKLAPVGDKTLLFDMPAPDVNKTAMIVFTSGTTAEPRGVELSIRGLECFAELTERRLDMKCGDKSLMLLPLFHIYGMAATYAMLAQGVALGVCPDYRRIFDAVMRFNARFLFMVPALADILAAKIERRSASVESALGFSIDWICTGGAPISLRTHERLVALGVKMLGAYGLTETSAVFSMSDLHDEMRPCSAGKICDFAGIEVKVSESGELMVRGPNVFKGYFGEDAMLKATKDSQGWFSTGDTGRIDEDGYVWITGRMSRTIVLSTGKKVAPEELEAKILMHPGISEVLVTGNGDAREITAEVYADISDGEVYNAIAAINHALPVYMRIKRVVVRKEPFPRTSSGKICFAQK